MHPIVIVGSGLAGYTLLKEIRKRDAAVPVTLVTADDGAFYSKPNLSNALAAGKTAAALASASAEKMAAGQNATVLTHTRVTAIDTQRQRIRSDGGELEYRQLVLALGADPIPHGLVGSGAADVLVVNDLADYAAFRGAIDGKKRITVLGGGLIGCEFANDLVHAGFAVDVVHLGGWPLERLLPIEAGQRLAGSLAMLGVRWHFGRTGKGVEAAANGYRVVLDNGRSSKPMSCVGDRPASAPPTGAGGRHPGGSGIQADRLLQTGTANVCAIGDCVRNRRVNLPYVQPLMAQARALAATLTGTPTAVDVRRCR